MSDLNLRTNMIIDVRDLHFSLICVDGWTHVIFETIARAM